MLLIGLSVLGCGLGVALGYAFYLTLVALKPFIGSGYSQLGILVLFLFTLAGAGPATIMIAKKCCRE